MAAQRQEEEWRLSIACPAPLPSHYRQGLGEPQGYHSVTPYLVVEGAERLIDFLKRTFKAKEKDHMSPSGRVAHPEEKIGDCIVMLSDATQESKAMPSQLYVYVDEVDAVYK